ncbi:MAG: cell filamentation protein Fic [Elusimicrobia bacterium CG_4_9_14_3_um_filter_62_55]|nr:MAG: cell filamentation protein Fic [Elusimicrobia bacterium CG22_combo_CG10-13_8_21_14_all_63_91]PJA11741.1 MAG: cell filamentation protein Fic [Elusimicrobia bacterium CG_4_10_14_0_2_um_filter_63_34]PJB25143.1 MAG: cell filamentation protein Fic [Elusimicrobia bacterium CG_4_9_14_3_um_filter_62_55]
MRFDFPDGATPIEDAEGLIPGEIVTYRDLCAVEAENILAAADKHLSRRKNQDGAWLDEPFLRKLHADMFGRVWRWAGEYRQTELNIGVAPHKVAEEIGRLLGDLRYWHANPAGMPVLERAVRLHHRLSWIHPFRNGNGRHARMAADVYLHSQKHPLPEWPGDDLTVTTETRKRYLQALRAADQEDFGPLLAFSLSLLP